MSTEIRKSQSIEIKNSQGSMLSEHAQAVGHLCPKRGDTMPKPWGDNARGLGNLAHPHVSIPNPTCQSSILFLVSIYILHILFLLSIDLQNPFYKIKRQKKVGMGIKKRRKKRKKGITPIQREEYIIKNIKGKYSKVE